MSTLKTRLLAALCAVGLSVGAAQATPVNLVEGDIDFDTLAPVGSVLTTLGVGTNTISGSIEFTCAFFSNPCDLEDGADTSDDIRLRLAEGTRLSSGGNLQVSNATVQNFIEFYSDGVLVAFTLPFDGEAFISALTGDVDGPSDLAFSVAASLPAFGGGILERFDYTITFEVIQTGPIIPNPSPIPLPASGLMLFAALGAGAIMRRRIRD